MEEPPQKKKRDTGDAITWRGVAARQSKRKKETAQPLAISFFFYWARCGLGLPGVGYATFFVACLVRCLLMTKSTIHFIERGGGKRELVLWS